MWSASVVVVRHESADPAEHVLVGFEQEGSMAVNLSS